MIRVNAVLAALMVLPLGVACRTDRVVLSDEEYATLQGIQGRLAANNSPYSVTEFAAIASPSEVANLLGSALLACGTRNNEFR